MQEMQEIKNTLRNWIANKLKIESASDIADDALILEERILKSIHIVDLILFMEHKLNRKIQIEQIQPESFASINNIYSCFFE